MKTMIALVGEQPLSNLLPIRHISPQKVMLLYTTLTEAQAKRLQKILGKQHTVQILEVNPYDVVQAQGVLTSSIGSSGDEQLIFNITGGTKTMMIAAYEVARQHSAEMVYLQTEGKSSKLYQYQWNTTNELTLSSEVSLAVTINAEEFLYLQTGKECTSGGYTKEPLGAKFEQAVHHAIQTAFDEVLTSVKILGALEVDFVIRQGNRFGIIEAKVGKADKTAIGQLTTAGNPEYLGRYTKRFLVMGRAWDTSSNLQELAEAHGIEVIALTSYNPASGQISEADAANLVHRIKERI